MALKPLDIFKLLPKTNCKECGYPTCLAFSMQIAMGKEDLKKCPYVSDEAKKQLSAAAAPPIITISIGKGEEKVNIGGETVLFRHEKTFYNPTAIGVLIDDDMPDQRIEEYLQNTANLTYERVGLKLKANVIAIRDNKSGKFIDIVERAHKTSKALILMSHDISLLEKALGICKDVRPVLYAATKENFESLGKLAKSFSVPIAVKGKTIDEMEQVAGKLQGMGIEEIVLCPENTNISELFKNLILLRRKAIMKRVKECGYPVLAFLPDLKVENYIKEALNAAICIAKYASIVILSQLKGETLFPLLLERLNIFTDPQRPMATTEGIYEIGRPGPESPVLVTSNFSLTYFIISGEIENSRIPAYLLVQDTEGLSVLTAWAADKLNAETIAALIKKTKIEEKLGTKKLIIPGVLAQILGELEEELPDWKISLGPREAAYLPVFLKSLDSGQV
ncbi:MAG: acetyl-CoA decarbonylase/synthase complex subunit gamma [Candidatus Omnitrophica bacterium]|nr:acetyl-CoA decarbonylase/synthase complex subunit gamma [Candidatus Omnitrophota bacterium]MCM8828843.1 acetyl-CoA decarbonylase/synthase complex subunit gamma [Candidatus Omnitrophota bacterium]